VTSRIADAGNGRLEATVVKAGPPMTASSEASFVR
jgi:hypothetical protein